MCRKICNNDILTIICDKNNDNDNGHDNINDDNMMRMRLLIMMIYIIQGQEVYHPVGHLLGA